MNNKNRQHTLSESEDWGDVCDNTYDLTPSVLRVETELEQSDDPEETM